ncbi:MAG: DNA-3-methyladenine glycosylase 2 family protein [Acidobacteria bacterium]|nr:DNA-3-methyladenine glycosylase 2 family protein [Acidobacteriota bacterium]
MKDKLPVRRKTLRGAGGADGWEFDAREAMRYLSAADSRMAELIEAAGPFKMQLRTMHNPFETLARNIIYQQLHGNAAAAIHDRVRALFKGQRLRPQDVLAAPEDELRGAGLSRAKTASLKDLAAKTLDGTVPTLARLKRMEDEEIIERLTAVRGIGRWTAEMLLMSRLGRPDVLPVGDYAVRKGYALVYGLAESPTQKELTILAEPWRPFRTVASWYMWRALELPPDSLPRGEAKRLN